MALHQPTVLPKVLVVKDEMMLRLRGGRDIVDGKRHCVSKPANSDKHRARSRLEIGLAFFVRSQSPPFIPLSRSERLGTIYVPAFLFLAYFDPALGRPVFSGHGHAI